MGRWMILAEADRARFGCDERLPFDPGGITNKEAVALAEYGGWATPRLWYRALNLRPVYLNPDGTARVLGEGEAAPEGDWFDLANDPVAWTFAVWMTLRRAGIETKLEDLEFNLQRLRIEDDDDETPVPKDDAAVEENPTPTTSIET